MFICHFLQLGYHVYTVRSTFSFRYQLTLQDTVVTIRATSINKFSTLPTQCTYVFRMILTTNKHFPTHHWPAGRHNWAAACFLWGRLSNCRNSEEFNTSGSAMNQVVSRSHLTAESWIRSPANCSAQTGTGTGFYASTLAFCCRYNSINTPYSFSS